MTEAKNATPPVFGTAFALSIDVAWTPNEHFRDPAGVDLSVAILGPTGKVRSDGDFAFYNQPSIHGDDAPAGAAPGTVVAGVNLLPSAGATTGATPRHWARISWFKLSMPSPLILLMLSVHDPEAIGLLLSDLGEITIRLEENRSPASGSAGRRLAIPLTIGDGYTAAVVGALAVEPGGGATWRPISAGTSKGLARLAASYGVIDEDAAPRKPR